MMVWREERSDDVAVDACCEKSQCVGNWTCAFSTHSSALYSQLHHFL